MAIKFYADLNLNKSELQSVALETLSANPSSPSTGQIYFHTTDDEVKIYNGSSWQVVGKSYTAGGGLSLSGTEFSVDSTVIRTTGAQTKAGNMTFSNNVTITGNLTVNGTQTILNTAELAVEDTNIELNSGASAGADSGISVNRGQGEDVPQLLWDESADRWTFTNDGSTFYNIPLSTEYNNYSLPTATASALGGVKIGSGISISSGVISADSQTDNNFTNALKTKLDGIASSADNYGSWTASDGTNSETIGSGTTVQWRGSGATTVSYDDSSNTFTISSTDTNTNTQLSKETVQDYIGEMLTGNTETNITVTYDDTNNKINFVSTDTNTQLTDAQVRSKISGTGLISYNSSTGVISTTANNYSLPTASSSVLGGIKVGTNLSIDGSGVLSATDTNTQLSNEQVQDIVGAMVSSNTETNIAVTYNDTTGKLNFVATDTDTTYSAGEGISLSGTTINNNYHTYVGSVTGATSISVDGTTHDVRYPATIQVYDNEGYQVFAETQMNTSTRDVSISGLASGDYDYVISGKRA